MRAGRRVCVRTQAIPSLGHPHQDSLVCLVPTLCTIVRPLRRLARGKRRTRSSYSVCSMPITGSCRGSFRYAPDARRCANSAAGPSVELPSGAPDVAFPFSCCTSCSARLACSRRGCARGGGGAGLSAAALGPASSRSACAQCCSARWSASWAAVSCVPATVSGHQHRRGCCGLESRRERIGISRNEHVTQAASLASTCAVARGRRPSSSRDCESTLRLAPSGCRSARRARETHALSPRVAAARVPDRGAPSMRECAQRASRRSALMALARWRSGGGGACQRSRAKLTTGCAGREGSCPPPPRAGGGGGGYLAVATRHMQWQYPRFRFAWRTVRLRALAGDRDPGGGVVIYLAHVTHAAVAT